MRTRNLALAVVVLALATLAGGCARKAPQSRQRQHAFGPAVQRTDNTSFDRADRELLRHHEELRQIDRQRVVNDKWYEIQRKRIESSYGNPFGD